MIKNLLWKQAMEAAKKKFGNLNTNEAVKFLNEQYKILVDKIDTYNKANKKAVEEFKGFKPEVVPKYDPFKNLRGDESFDELLELGGKKIKKFDPFKKEGKKIDFGKYHDKRKRGEFDEGGKVYSAEDINRRLKTLKEVRQGLAPSSYLYLRDELVKDALASGLISEEDYFNKWQKPFFGERGEKWTDAIDAYEQRNFNEGGFTGSPVYFQDKFNEYDFATRYNMMSPKEGLEQLLQDIKNTDFIKSMKMEEGELGKLPPIPSSILMRLGLGSIIKNMRSPKGLYEKLKETPESPLLVSDFKTTVGGTSRRDLLQLLFGKKKKYSKKELEQLKKLDDSKITLGKNLEKFWKDFYKHLDDPEKFSKPTMPRYEIDTAEEILKKAIDKKTTFHAEGGLAGMLGETRSGYQGGGYLDYWKMVQDSFYSPDVGGEEGTGMTIHEYADIYFPRKSEGGRVGLKGGGMTPSEAWMRAYFFDGKGGYDDSGMTWDYFKKHIGPGLWYKHIGKYAEGGRAGYLKGGLLKTGIMEALDQFTNKRSGDWAVNFGEVRDLFTNLDKTFAGKITSKESIDDIITRFRDNRKLNLADNIKEFLNNKIKQYKSGLENIKKYGQSNPIEEVGDYAEELKYLIKETRKDLDAIDKYGVIQQSKKATKHAEGGVVGLKDGGTLLEKYKEYAPKGPWTKGLTDAEITYELYNLLAPYMSLFMKEGGRVGFKEGKGMTRRTFLKLMGAAATLPVVGKFFKLAKPASKVMDDIKITLRGDGDWERDIDGMWSGGNWVNYSFEALTDKGRKILAKLSKGKNASLVDQGDGVYFPGKTVSSKAGNYLIDEADHAVEAVDAIKKSKGNISLNTRVGKNTKGIDKSQKKYPGESTDSTEHFKTYGSKDINKKTILDEADDMWVGDYGGYRNKGFYDESVEEIIDIINPTKKAEGGRIGLDAGGPPISPANLHPLQRPMFYQGGLTKTVPPQRGPMPQGLQSDVYDGIMRPGVINGRN